MLTTTIILIILESLTWQEIATTVAAVVFAFYLWKSGIPQQMFTATNGLLTVRTTERDDAIRERDKHKNNCEELQEEMRMLRREIVQRIDINLQDQNTIRQIRQELREYENEKNSNS